MLEFRKQKEYKNLGCNVNADLIFNGKFNDGMIILIEYLSDFEKREKSWGNCDYYDYIAFIKKMISDLDINGKTFLHIPHVALVVKRKDADDYINKMQDYVNQNAKSLNLKLPAYKKET
jgi:hypothetical protein